MAGMLEQIFGVPVRPDVVEAMDDDSVLRRQRADAEAALAARGPVTPRVPRQAPTVALRLPERTPGQRVGDVATHCAVDQLHRALRGYARGLTPARRKRLEKVLADLDDVLTGEAS